MQHGFYAEASGTPSMFGHAGWLWYNSRSSGIVRFVQGGVVKTFRCRSLIRLENYDPCVGANSDVAIGLLPAKAVRVLAALQAVPTTLQTSHADQ